MPCRDHAEARRICGGLFAWPQGPCLGAPPRTLRATRPASGLWPPGLCLTGEGSPATPPLSLSPPPAAPTVFGTAIRHAGTPGPHPCAKTGEIKRFRHSNPPCRHARATSVCQNWHRRRKVAGPAATDRALWGAPGKGSPRARLLPRYHPKCLIDQNMVCLQVRSNMRNTSICFILKHLEIVSNLLTILKSSKD